MKENTFPRCSKDYSIDGAIIPRTRSAESTAEQKDVRDAGTS